MKKLIASAVLCLISGLIIGQVKSYRVDSLWNVANTNKSVVQKAKAYVELSELLGERDLDTVPYFCKKAIALLEGKYSYTLERKDDIYNTLALAYNNMGVYFGVKKNISQSLPYFQKSYEYYKKGTDVARKISATQNLGATYSRMGDLVTAMKYYDESLNLAITNNYSNGLAEAYEKIADLNFRIKEYQKAIEYRVKALEIAEKNNNEKLKMTLYVNMGIVYIKLNKPYEALNFYRKGQLIAEKLNNEYALSTVYNNIGDVYDKLNQKDSAFYYLNKTILLREKNKGSPAELSLLYNNLSRLYVSVGKYDEALIAGEKAYEMSVASGKIVDKYQAKEVLTKAYSSLGKYKEAYESYMEFIRLKDSVFSETNKKNIIKREYDLELKQKELEAKLEKERMALENEKRLEKNQMLAEFEKESQKLKLLQEKEK